ncbi:MAG TPA: single-stranded DNA-binding protein [Anaerolineales bacterium]|nr:single-stranded DNA-binding protein [Anaerolineales bacterium]
MSKQYNKTTFVGHLGTDPEMRYTPSGIPVTSFNVANNDQYTNDKDEVVKTTTWFRCTAWGKQAEVCNQYLHKGSKVLVEGKLTPDKKTGRPRIWTRQDGTAAADFELKIFEIHFLDNRNGGESVEVPAPPEDDIPF